VLPEGARQDGVWYSMPPMMRVGCATPVAAAGVLLRLSGVRVHELLLHLQQWEGVGAAVCSRRVRVSIAVVSHLLHYLLVAALPSISIATVLHLLLKLLLPSAPDRRILPHHATGACDYCDCDVSFVIVALFSGLSCCVQLFVLFTFGSGSVVLVGCRVVCRVRCF
jgi:hypothetical protein